MILCGVTLGLLQIFEESCRELRPCDPIPELTIEFFPFAGLKSTVRMREGKLRIRLSDALEGAPENILQAIAHILLAKIYRKEIEPRHLGRYRRYVSSHEMRQKTNLLRRIRGRKSIQSAQGRNYNLEAIFEQLNTIFFDGLMARPVITWSRSPARNRLGHYDPAHNTIVISRVFDRSGVPRAAVEYIVYHEMLHLKHPVKLKGSRCCIHSAEFQADEKLFPQLDVAKSFLKRI